MKKLEEVAEEKYPYTNENVGAQLRRQFNREADELRLAFIAGAQWQLEQSQWISVEKRLPEKDGYVWAYSETFKEENENSNNNR